jgi:hypothetical protein
VRAGVRIHGMSLGLACPEGTTVCNDVRSDNLLWLFFPLAVGFALLLAEPLTRFLPHRPLIGWPLAIIGAVVLVYFYVVGSEPFPWLLGVFMGFLIGVIGIGLARGKSGVTEPHTA